MFPCRPDDKRPAVPDWERRACADPERVGRYWPSDRHNVGLACGPSRLVVLDLDTHGELPAEWRELPGVNDGRDVLAWICEAAGMDWPQTHTVSTPSGGWHLYFTAPEDSGIRNSASLIGPQVDVRAAGGYVVAAGSVVDGKAYEVLYDDEPAPLPAWIARLLKPHAESAGGGTFTPSGQPAKRLEGLLRTVAAAKPGTRNDTLFWAASRAAEMTSAGQVDERDAAAQLLAASAAAGLSGQEAMRTITSAMRGGR